jgi:GNAT superfamily N-acetyltransferase
MSDAPGFIWESARDAEEIHALLCASDAFVATPEAPPPKRNRATTQRLIDEGATQVLRHDGRAVASINLLWTPPFEMGQAQFPPAARPAFLARLAVDPEWAKRGSILGAQCIRRAMDLALERGADAIRCEANPDLTRTRAMLGLFGFSEHGAAQDPDGRRRVYLHLALSPR